MRETIGCQAEGIGVIELDAFTTLVVRTANSVYRITILKPYAREVLVEGGTHFPERTRAYLSGSSAMGRPLKLGWVGLGLHLEFQAAGRRIITSRVRSIALEPPLDTGRTERHSILWQSGSCISTTRVRRNERRCSKPANPAWVPR